jgi:hypothetical protein
MSTQSLEMDQYCGIYDTLTGVQPRERKSARGTGGQRPRADGIRVGAGLQTDGRAEMSMQGPEIDQYCGICYTLTGMQSEERETAQGTGGQLHAGWAAQRAPPAKRRAALYHELAAEARVPRARHAGVRPRRGICNSVVTSQTRYTRAVGIRGGAWPQADRRADMSAQGREMDQYCGMCNTLMAGQSGKHKLALTLQ